MKWIELLTQAYRRINFIADDQPITATQLNHGRLAINTVLAKWAYDKIGYVATEMYVMPVPQDATLGTHITIGLTEQSDLQVTKLPGIITNVSVKLGEPYVDDYIVLEAATLDKMFRNLKGNAQPTLYAIERLEDSIRVYLDATPKLREYTLHIIAVPQFDNVEEITGTIPFPYEILYPLELVLAAEIASLNNIVIPNLDIKVKALIGALYSRPKTIPRSSINTRGL